MTSSQVANVELISDAANADIPQQGIRFIYLFIFATFLVMCVKTESQRSVFLLQDGESPLADIKLR